MASIHVIAKSDVAQHRSIPLESAELPTLGNGSVRVRSRIVALTANNLSYSRLGGMMHWWDAYPVPAQLPAPYNDQAQYGVVPAWGYGEILDSKVDPLQPGMLLWGFWPTHDLPVDLHLEAKGAGQWVETSEARSRMMTSYNQYSVNDATVQLHTLSQGQLDDLAWEAIVRPVGGAGWLLNRCVFGDLAIHPAGAEGWSAQQADLTRSVVVNLSASGKTARTFTDALVHDRRPGTGPLAMLAITASSDADLVPAASFPVKTVSYAAASEPQTWDWIAGHQPDRVVVVNFGGRGNALRDVLGALQQHLAGVPVLTIMVGAEPKVMSLQDFGAAMASAAAIPNCYQMNASPLRDAAVKVIPPEVLARDVQTWWEGFVKRGNLKKMQLQWGEGVQGEGGFEGGYQRLCEQKLPRDAGLAYKL